MNADDSTEKAEGATAAVPEEMSQMVHALGVEGLLTDAERAEAAGFCTNCPDRDACRQWLDVAVIRGADHAPDFCLNKKRFAELASEAPATI